MPNNNIYIGERYIPIFADPVEWDGSRAYEHLMIVLYEGEGYTSRYAVPPGIDIANEKYWVKSYPRSPKILELEALINSIRIELAQQADEIASIKEQIKDNTADITAEINAIKDKNTEQDNRLETIEEHNTTQDEEIANLKEENEAQDTRLTSLENTTTEQGNEIEAIKNKNTEQDYRLETIEEHNTAQDDEIDKLKEENEAQGTRLTALENTTTEQGKEIEAINNKNTEQDNRLEVIETKDSVQDEKLDSLEQEQTLQDKEITRIRQEQNTQNTDIQNLKDLTAKHTQDIQTNENDIDLIKSNMDTLGQRQDSIETRLNEQETELNAANLNIRTLTNRVTNQDIVLTQHAQQITDLHSDITTLQEHQATTDTQLANITENLTQTNTKVTAIENEIETINEKLENVPGEITDLTEQVNKNTAEIEKNDTDILALQTKTNTHSEQIGTITSDITEIEAKNTEQDNKLSDLKNTTDTNTTQINEMKTELDSQKIIVDGLTDDYQSLSTHVSGITSKVDTNTQDILQLQNAILSSKYVYNINDYGAKGDGITDNRAAFQRFFSETKATAVNEYVTLVIPTGVYLIDGQIVMEGNYNIIGVGYTVLNITTGPGACNMYIGGETTTSGHIYGIEFQGSGSNEYFNLDNTYRVIFEKCVFNARANMIVLISDTAQNNGVFIVDCDFNEPVRYAISDMSSKTNYQIFVTGTTFHSGSLLAMSISHTNRIVVENCVVNSDKGLNLVDSYDVIISNNLSYTNQFARFVHIRRLTCTNNSIVGKSGENPLVLCETLFSAVISNNNIDTTYQGISCKQCDRTIINANSITHITAIDTDSCAILISGGYCISVTNNQVSNLNFGMSISKGTNFTGLMLTNNVAFYVNTGIEVQSGIGNLVNENNLIVTR